MSYLENTILNEMNRYSLLYDFFNYYFKLLNHFLLFIIEFKFIKKFYLHSHLPVFLTSFNHNFMPNS